MFERTAIIPRITREQLDEMEIITPGLSLVATIPVIETAEQAVELARVQVEKGLGPHSSMNRKASKIEEFPDGWKISFPVSGFYIELKSPFQSRASTSSSSK